MAPLVVAAGVVAAGAAAYRIYKVVSESVAAELDKVRDPLRRQAAMEEGVKLIRDPLTGEYRPERKN